MVSDAACGLSHVAYCAASSIGSITGQQRPRPLVERSSQRATVRFHHGTPHAPACLAARALIPAAQPKLSSDVIRVKRKGTRYDRRLRPPSQPNPPRPAGRTISPATRAPLPVVLCCVCRSRSDARAGHARRAPIPIDRRHPASQQHSLLPRAARGAGETKQRSEGTLASASAAEGSAFRG